MGINGVAEIKIHPFFAGVEWNKLKDKVSPYIPEVKNEVDTTNFDKYDEEEPWIVNDPNKSKKKNRK